jgi:hypothetical protein
MLRSLPAFLICCLVAISCSTSSKNPSKPQDHREVNTAALANPEIPSDLTPSSIFDLPRSQDGAIVLSEGWYEGEFRSYCLQPGTPDPSSLDAYLQEPLSGYRKDIVESVLRQSLDRPDLQQRNVQLLLWSVVSGSDFNKLSPSVRSTARELLTPKQVFALQGGMMGVVKAIAASMPETGLNRTFTDMRNLFELGNSSYEAYESLAVLRQPSLKTNPNYKTDQWYPHEGGYFVRYFPNGYQRTKIEVYIPKGSLDADGRKKGEYLLFDPVHMMAVPANSNAQRLGIGAPVADVIRKVIEIQRVPGAPRRAPAPKPNPGPKGIVLN